MRTLSVGLLIVMVVSLLCIATGKLDVYFINVGQGDAILIDYGECEMLIDGGSDGSWMPFLNQYVDGPLEVMVATHPHADHIGELDEVLDVFDVDAIITNGAGLCTSAYLNFYKAALAEECSCTTISCDDWIRLGDLTFMVLHPDELTGDANEDSLVLLMKFKSVSFLFMGDIGEATDKELLEKGCLADVDVLKVAHHGSRYGTTEAFLEVTQPEIAVYSAGAGNQYGHPHDETLQRLEAAGAEVMGTDLCGTICISTDGEEVWVATDTQEGMGAD